MNLTIKLLFTSSLVLVSGPLIAQEDTFDPLGKAAEANLPRQVRVQVEYIEMPLEQMSAVMSDATATKTDTILRRRLAKLIQNGKAKLIDHQMIVARSGEKATVESIREFIYPTEYEPAELPSTVKIEKGAEGEVSTRELATGPTPTAFETRNLGSTLEVEPTIDANNKTIDIRLSPEIAYHVENTVWAEWKDKHGESNIMMPVIYSLRITTAATVADGHPCLIAALSPKDEKGVTDPSRKILVFIKADVMVIGRK